MVRKYGLNKDFYGRKVVCPVIWGIGDSHTQYLESVIARHPECSSLYEMPPTAWKLLENDSTSRGRRRLFSALNGLRDGDKLLLSYGEVDARIHIPYRHLYEGDILDDCINETVERYGKVLMQIKEMKKDDRIIVHGIVPMGTLIFKDYTPPETPDELKGIEYYELMCEQDYHMPIATEQMLVHYTFNERLKKFCETNGFRFFDIMPYVGPTGRMKAEWLRDKHHLKSTAFVFFAKWAKEQGIEIGKVYE